MGLDQYLYAQRRLEKGFNVPERMLRQLGYEDECYIMRERCEGAIVAKASGLSGVIPSGEDDSFYLVRDGDALAARFTVGYWRKANQVHGWFVRKAMSGVDECQLASIDRSMLIELRDICKTVISGVETVEGDVRVGTVMTKSPDGEIQTHHRYESGRVVTNVALAQRLLPTQSGFFFGGTDYDQFYLSDLDTTVVILDLALKAPDDTQFFYRASW